MDVCDQMCNANAGRKPPKKGLARGCGLMNRGVSVPGRSIESSRVSRKLISCQPCGCESAYVVKGETVDLITADGGKVNRSRAGLHCGGSDA